MRPAPTKSPSINRARLLAPTLPANRASVEELHERVRSTIRVENQAAAIRAEALAELRRRKGGEQAETVLQKGGLLSRRRARSEVETARELSELPKTSEGLRKGEIPYDNARIIARANQRGDIDERELVVHARTQSPDKFAITVRQHEQQRSEDDGMSRLEHQRSRRFARVTTDRDDGMTILYGRFDPITGAGIEAMLSRRVEQLWRDEDPRNRRTPGQRMADALEDLVTQPGGEDRGGSRGARLLLIAQYDTVHKSIGGTRLADGTPVPAGEVRRLACDAEVLPAIFDGASQPLDVGRSRRVATPAQRVALVARDGGCVGCGASANWCQAHHITHWMDGGPTDLDNLCLLCSRCHHRVHDNGWQVERSTAGRFSLRPPPNRRARPSPPYRRYQRRRRRRHPAKQRK